MFNKVLRSRSAASLSAPAGTSCILPFGRQLWHLQGAAEVAPRALGIRNTNAPAGKPPAAAIKGAAGKRGGAGTGAKVKSSSAAALNAGPADDDDAGLAAGTLSKAEAEEKMLGLFGEGSAPSFQHV